MTNKFPRYVAVEVAVSVFMSAMMNSIMHFVIFGARAVIPVAGAGGAVFDAVPTTFMTVLMCAVMPGWLTERRAAKGAVSMLDGRVRRLPGNAFLRALLLAAAGAMAVGGLLSLAVKIGGPASIGFYTMLVLKLILSVVVPFLVTPFAIRESLSCPASHRSESR